MKENTQRATQSAPEGEGAEEAVGRDQPPRNGFPAKPKTRKSRSRSGGPFPVRRPSQARSCC